MDDAEPLGEVLARALEASEARPRIYAQPQVSSITIERKAAAKPTEPSIFELAKGEDAARYIEARRASRR
jgi:hypothetical protein